MKKPLSIFSIRRVFRAAAKNKAIVILSGLLFFSMAYNIWWVGYERDGSADTINKLNRYIELSTGVLMKVNDYSKLREEYSVLATQALFECSDGDMSKAAQNADGLAELGARISVQKEQVITALDERTEFAKNSGLEVFHLEETE